MKSFKIIVVFSDGSFYFSSTSNTKTISINNYTSFQKEDDKSFILNKKKHKKNIEYKYSFYYKKKYFKCLGYSQVGKAIVFGAMISKVRFLLFQCN